MKLFGKEFGKSKQNSDVPADLQQYYNTGGSNVGKLILRIVIFVLVLALIVWGGIWLFNKLTDGNDNQQASNNTSQQEEADQAAADKQKAEEEAKKAADEAAKKAEEARKKADEEAKKRAEANNTTPAPATTNTENQSTDDRPVGGVGGGEPSTQTAELPNSGPGEVAAVMFAGTAVIGAVLHALFLRRKAVR